MRKKGKGKERQKETKRSLGRILKGLLFPQEGWRLWKMGDTREAFSLWVGFCDPLHHTKYKSPLKWFWWEWWFHGKGTRKVTVPKERDKLQIVTTNKHENLDYGGLMPTMPITTCKWLNSLICPSCSSLAPLFFHTVCRHDFYFQSFDFTQMLV